MRITGYIDRTNQKQHLFTALVQECQLANPTSRYRLRSFWSGDNVQIILGCQIIWPGELRSLTTLRGETWSAGRSTGARPFSWPAGTARPRWWSTWSPGAGLPSSRRGSLKWEGGVYWQDNDNDNLVQVEEEGVRHSVTPLWCAAVSGRLAVVRVLLR